MQKRLICCYVIEFHISTSVIFAFTTLWANSADDKIGNIFFSFFYLPENRIWHFRQIVSSRDNLPEMSYPVFWEKYEENVLMYH